MLHNTGMKGIVTSVEPSTPTVLRWARLAQGRGQAGVGLVSPCRCRVHKCTDGLGGKQEGG